LNNLANVYGAQGEYARSLAMHLRALAIYEKHASPWSQPVLSLGNIARTYAALGDFANALKFQQRVDAALDADMALNLAIGSERQKIAYLNMIAERTERTLSFHLRLQPDNAEAARLAVGTLLRRKGRVLDVMTNTLAARRAQADPDEQRLLDQLADTTTRFARLALAGPGKMTPDDHVRQLRELQDTKERLEADISRRSEEARAALQRVSLGAVQQAIPAGVTLIEFAVYRPFDSRAQSMTVAYGAARYAAYVVQADEVVGLDLGEAATIDPLVEAYRSALQDPARADVKRLARSLDERIMQPLRRIATDASRLLVSPDGPLALIPFEALVDENGRYLVERYPVSYVSAGRDLLRMQVARTSRSAPVVLADPLFGEPDAVPGPPADARATAPSASRRRSITAAADVTTMYFAPLAGTRYEAQSIQSVFPDAQVLSGPRATKAALAALQAPRILHVATHGFFIEPRRDASPGQAAGARRPSPDAAAPGDNPLLRSGLALAGANLAATGTDGILTALEAAHLNLWGTKLVTLSACDTGVGVVRNGDGVYGLRRSIFLAGAETLVMSLWPVSDAITREMMTAYYEGLKTGMGRGEALRQVQLSMLERKGREHPFYWASFIQAGEWANLEGRR
jgi:CHAT domain-containing protein